MSSRACSRDITPTLWLRCGMVRGYQVTGAKGSSYQFLRKAHCLTVITGGVSLFYPYQVRSSVRLFWNVFLWRSMKYCDWSKPVLEKAEAAQNTSSPWETSLNSVMNGREDCTSILSISKRLLIAFTGRAYGVSSGRMAYLRTLSEW